MPAIASITAHPAAPALDTLAHVAKKKFGLSPSRSPETPVLVINLDRSPRRLAGITAQLDALGLPFHRIAAADGLALSANEHQRHYCTVLNRRLYHKSLSAGEIGCYISHLRAWQWLLDSGFERAVILEDDAVLGENFRTMLDLLPYVPPPWDVVKLGSVSRKPVLDSTPLGEFSLRRYRKTPISAFAQVVSRQGAEKLLHTRVPFARPVDVDLQHVWETGLAVCGLEPYPVQANLATASDICRASCRSKIPARRLMFFQQRLQFAVRQWRHNLGQRNWLPRAANTLATPPRRLGPVMSA